MRKPALKGCKSGEKTRHCGSAAEGISPDTINLHIIDAGKALPNIDGNENIGTEMASSIVQDTPFRNAPKNMLWEADWAQQFPVNAALYLFQVSSRIVNGAGLVGLLLKRALPSHVIKWSVVGVCVTSDFS